MKGGRPRDACSLSPAWAQMSRRPQLALFQGRAEPWEQTQIRRIWCLFFCAFAFEVEGTQKRYYSSAYPPVAPLNMSQSPPRSAARDVASAAVEIDFKHICPLGPRQRRGPALAPPRRRPVMVRSGGLDPWASRAGHEVPAPVDLGERSRRQYQSRRRFARARAHGHRRHVRAPSRPRHAHHTSPSP